MHIWLHCHKIFVYNCKQSHKSACFEWPHIHVEESFSTSMNNVILFDATGQTDITFANSVRVIIPITR